MIIVISNSKSKLKRKNPKEQFSDKYYVKSIKTESEINPIQGKNVRSFYI